MRVLHCIWRMNIGGAEQQLVLIANALAAQSVDVHVVTVYAGPNDGPIGSSGATSHRLRAFGKYDPLLLPRLARLCWRLRPDVVHTWLTQMDILAGAAAELLSIPWILGERSVAAAYPPNLLHGARAVIGARADMIVANSEGGREYWRKYVKNEARLRVIPNIVPLTDIEKARPEVEGFGQAGEVILFVGRLSVEKNLNLLLDALAMVMKAHSVTAVFCGDGPLRGPLEQRARALGLTDRMFFLGFVTNVWSWMKRASVVVNPSMFEGNPNAVLEAIACGAPLVVSDIPGHRALVDDCSAWIIDPASTESLAAGLVAALTDRAEARARAARARQLIASRSADEIATRFKDVYREAARPGRAEVMV